MKSLPQDPLAAAAALLATTAALADINIGVTLSLTGPASGLGIPASNQFKLWPQTIAGEKVNLIILDDATDPDQGRAERAPLRHRRQGRHDLRLGSSRRRPSRWPVAAEAKTVQLAALAGGPAARARSLDLPPAAEQRRDGQRDRRAHEEARRQDASASWATPTPTASSG